MSRQVDWLKKGLFATGAQAVPKLYGLRGALLIAVGPGGDGRAASGHRARSPDAFPQAGVTAEIGVPRNEGVCPGYNFLPRVQFLHWKQN
jgi:hypothetical protein